MKSTRKTNAEPYVCVSNRIFVLNLKYSAIIVYAALCVFRNGNTNEARPSQATLAKMCRLSIDTVRSALYALEAAGMVSMFHRHMQCCVYTINFDRNRGYCRVPRRVFDTHVSTITKVLWLRLCRYAGKSGSGYAYRRDAAKECGMSLSSIDRARRELVELEIATIEAQFLRVGDQGANIFHMLAQEGAVIIGGTTRSISSKFAPRRTAQHRNTVMRQSVLLEPCTN